MRTSDFILFAAQITQKRVFLKTHCHDLLEEQCKKLKVKCIGSLFKNAWLFCRDPKMLGSFGQRPWGQGLGNVLAGNAFRGMRPGGKETPEGCMPSYVKSVDQPRKVGENKTESVRTKRRAFFWVG